MGEAEHAAFVDEKRRKRMDGVDSMEPALRALVHEYGLTVVASFIQIGVSKPKHIRHLVETVLDEFSPTRGSFSHQGIRNHRNLARGYILPDEAEPK